MSGIYNKAQQDNEERNLIYLSQKKTIDRNNIVLQWKVIIKTKKY